MTRLLVLLTCCVLCGCTADKDTSQLTSPREVDRIIDLTMRGKSYGALININYIPGDPLVLATGITVTATEISCSHALFLISHTMVHNVSYARDQVTGFWPIEPGMWPPMPKGD